jgi:peptidoglycan hydrolase-like protein with peptidoglycan-binding domain
MFVFTGDSAALARWIRDEIELEEVLSEGRRGRAVKRVQEWLTLHGFGVAIDSEFGAVTKRAVQRFQAHAGLPATGVVDRRTFDRLVQPMKEALAKRAPTRGTRTVEDAVMVYARAHLDRHPVEVGGQNRGPWVRMYMKGNDGPEWAWCAGFVSFVLSQAVESLDAEMPIDGSFSCDSLAAQGKTSGLFIAERDASPSKLRAGSIFLVRRTPTDWTHTGLVSAAAATAFDTIEGNTNDDGHREGFEVCSRSRGYASKDFIRLS